MTGGYADNTYRPKTQVSRGQMAAFMNKLFIAGNF
ncbi:MAG: S-layer homology domain-containing protein [Bifidobacteriaceae bacterium]|nr:S-layer homology domain-containing protein [Bifidobacteriaceae bacterium]